MKCDCGNVILPGDEECDCGHIKDDNDTLVERVPSGKICSFCNHFPVIGNCPKCGM